MVYFKVLSNHLPGMKEGNRENTHDILYHGQNSNCAPPELHLSQLAWLEIRGLYLFISEQLK